MSEAREGGREGGRARRDSPLSPLFAPLLLCLVVLLYSPPPPPVQIIEAHVRKADARDKVEGDLHELVHADNDRGEAQVDDTPHAARDGESADRAGRSAHSTLSYAQLGSEVRGSTGRWGRGRWAVRAGSAAVDIVLDRLEQGRWRDGSNRAHPSAHLPDFPATQLPAAHGSQR